MKYEMKTGRLELYPGKEWENKTIQELLEYFHQSKKNRYLLVLNKQVLLNRQPVANDQVTLGASDMVTILLPRGEIDFTPSTKEANVIYEDDFVYVVHKDADIIVHSDDPNEDTLARQAAAWQTEHHINQPVRYIHRLDKDTSGVVLFVKHPFFQPMYDALLEEKSIQRTYMAITQGRGREGQHFTYRQSIGKDRHVNGKYRFSTTGKEAVTHVEFLEKKNDYLLVKCELETGRTHQIRVHLSGNRQPIVNDPLYGIASVDFKGMGLWAYSITFPNPINGKEITVTDNINSDYQYFNYFKSSNQ